MDAFAGEDFSEEDAEEARGQVALQVYGEAIREKYRALFATVEMAAAILEKELVSPEDIRQIIAIALDWLAVHDDPKWAEWRGELIESDVLSTSMCERAIRIGKDFAPCPPKIALSVAWREVPGHALRSLHGEETGDKAFEYGDFQGIWFVEEGNGAIIEACTTGKMPDRIYDRYVDTALAMDLAHEQLEDRVNLWRSELFEISYARQLIRAESNPGSGFPGRKAVG